MNKIIPDIRFARYTSKWDSKKIAEIALVTSGGTPSTKIKKYWNGDINWFTPSEIGSSTFVKSSKRKITELGLQKSSAMLLPAYKTILFTSRAGIGDMSILEKEAATNQGFQSLIINENNNVYFIYTMGEKLKKLATKYSAGSTFLEISGKELSKIQLFIPDIDEQTQIGIFFKELDELIELQQNTITKLEEVKKGFINTLFPSKGSMKPRIRLSGSNQSWNTKMLGELVSIATGKLNANAMRKNGEYNFYTSGISKYKIDTYSFVGPAITIAGNGATVGYMHLADGKFDAYQRTYVLNDIKADRLFLFYEIKNKLPRKIHEESRTGNIPYIVMDMVSKLSLKVPDVKTQKNIGSFMNHLDCLIDLENKELKLLQEMKKGFLQKMFV